MATVSLHHVYKIYPGDKGQEVVAVRDFTMDIANREFVVFVGPSGCGKSTTLRMIAGLEDISRGDISIDGRRVNDVAPKDRDIAMVFQNYALYPHMNVFDNMAFGLKLRKFPKTEIAKRVNDAAGILGLEQLLDRKPKALSGGQRQRVALGRAIVRQPKVFLFDEPLSNLDAKMRVQMRTEIIKLHQRIKATMIYVTHDQVEAMTMGTRIVVMDAVVNSQTKLKEGVVQQIDEPLKLYREPHNLFVAGFLGNPPMNFIHGKVEIKNDHCLFSEENQGTLRLDLGVRPSATPFQGKEVILGLRPECFEFVSAEKLTAPNTFPAVVDIVEPMGSETNLYLNTGAHTITCRTHAHLGHDQTGRRLYFQAQADQLHLFDPASTLRIV